MWRILIWLVDTAFSLYFLILIARVFLPLVRADPYHPIVQFIHQITEPLLAPLRRWAVVGSMDFSPLVVVVGLSIVRQILLTWLYSLAMSG
jgi:YggT family protein